MTVSEKLIRAAEHTAGCALRLRESVPVIETYKGETVWEGFVSIYDGAPAPVYAWAVKSDSGPQYVAVKGGGRIDSPLAAVRAWLASGNAR